MEIQCPKCQAVYRIKEPKSYSASCRVTCPKCFERFQVANTSLEPRAAEKSVQILIVDDARFFRELLLDVLAEREAELLSAESAKEAWDILQQKTIALLIVDINLPDVNGLKLISRIRQSEKLKELKILCVSGVYRQEDDALKALRAGADDFINKSFRPDELNQRIDKLLQQ